MTTPYALLAITALVIGAYALCALSREGWRRWGGPAMFGVVVCLLFALTFSSLGNARPGWLYRSWGPDVQVIAMTWEEGEAIWVLVRFSDNPEPVLIELPWSEEQAEKLNKALATATDEGGAVELELRGASGPEGPAAVHPKPPEAMPLKE